MDATFAAAGFFPIVAALVLWRGLRPVSEAELSRFAHRFGVVVERADRPLVAERLHRSRALRWGAAAAGVVIAGLP